MSLYLHTDGNLLHVSGGLAHDLDCCCSACTEDDGPCCLSGVEITAGGCECEELGGEIITDANPCECDQTSVSCCYEGNSINLSRCDCKTIGGEETGTCAPIGPVDGCDICISTTIVTLSYPRFWGCLTGNGNCATIPSICASTGQEMCFTGCDTVGTCFDCGGGPACVKTGGTFSYNSRTKTVTKAFCASSNVTTLTNNYRYAAPCDTVPTNYPITTTTIKSPIKGCGVKTYTETERTSSVVVGSGCAGVDVSTINSSSLPKTITCDPC